MPFTSGDLISERYQLQTRLGINGVRETWLITDLKDDKQWVLKLLYFGGDTHWQDLKLMEREAKTLQALQHSGIPRYSDTFWMERTAGHYFCLLQQYIPGTTLAEQLQKGERYDSDKRESLVRAMLDILQYLHGQSPPVVHRDIKPSNILIGDDGQFYLIDFGAVQAQVTGRGTMTVVGTYGYMPPEQFAAKAVPASDLYALGATILHLATGVDPAEMPRKGMRILFTPGLNLHISWHSWLMRLLEPELEQRCSSATQALQDFENREQLPTYQVMTDSGQIIPKRPPPLALKALSPLKVLLAGFGYTLAGIGIFWVSSIPFMLLFDMNSLLGILCSALTSSVLVGLLFLSARKIWR
jgi:serine/threonine protein kinase